MLEPVSPELAALELSRCLTLCAPSGMTQDDRTEWITIAMQEVEEIPSGAFEQACKIARTTCTHPSELMPAILSNAAAITDDLRSEHQWAVMALRNLYTPKVSAPVEPVISDEERAEVGRLMTEFLAEMQGKAVISN